MKNFDRMLISLLTLFLSGSVLAAAGKGFGIFMMIVAAAGWVMIHA